MIYILVNILLYTRHINAEFDISKEHFVTYSSLDTALESAR